MLRMTPAQTGLPDVTIAYLSLTLVRTAAQAHPFSPRAWDRNDTAEMANLLRRMESGAPFERDELPSVVVTTESEPLRSHVLTTGFIHLSARAAAIFRGHDLGDGFLRETPLIGTDGELLEGREPWFILHVGSVKTGLDVPASSGVKRAFGLVSLDAYGIETGEKTLVVTPEAAKGADVWRDEALTGQLYPFFSARLVQSLEEAKIAADFDLIACEAG